MKLPQDVIQVLQDYARARAELEDQKRQCKKTEHNGPGAWRHTSVC